MHSLPGIAGAASLLSFASQAFAIDLNVSRASSINDAAKTIAEDIIDMYPGNEEGEIPGLFPSPYYFWESGATWDSMINYWAKTGDDSYNDLVAEALLFQSGPENTFMPANQTKSLGNDDQASWAMAAMTAAERSFPVPSDAGIDSWLVLAQNVFETQTQRWDTDSCDGGLKWQIFSFNNGYNYKNAVSTGMLFQLSARLYSFTGNGTYYEWANESFRWLNNVGLVTAKGQVFDGTDDTQNCTELNHIQWSQNAGILISGMSYMWNATADVNWIKLLDTHINSFLTTFVTDESIMYEVACAPQHNCNVDQLAMLRTAARALYAVQTLVPLATVRAETGYNSSFVKVNEVLEASAKGAAASCTGGEDGALCGQDWSIDEYDGTYGLGQQLNALEVILANKGPAEGIIPLGNQDASNPYEGTGYEAGGGGLCDPTTDCLPGGGVLPINGTSSNSTGGAGAPTLSGSATPTQSAPVQQTDNAAVGLEFCSKFALAAGIGAVLGIGM